jgi:hypothetical protein
VTGGIKDVLDRQRAWRSADFRYNNRSSLGVDDNTRARTALKGITGKRLTYQQAR